MVSNLIQLGDNFSLPPCINKKTSSREFIKDFENYNTILNDKAKSKLRDNVIQNLDKFLHKNNSPISEIDRNLVNMYKAICSFCEMNPNIIFTRVDKGNSRWP